MFASTFLFPPFFPPQTFPNKCKQNSFFCQFSCALLALYVPVYNYFPQFFSSTHTQCSTFPPSWKISISQHFPSFFCSPNTNQRQPEPSVLFLLILFYFIIHWCCLNCHIIYNTSEPIWQPLKNAQMENSPTDKSRKTLFFINQIFLS